MAKLSIADLTAEALRPYVGQTLAFQRPAGEEHVTAGRVELELFRVSAGESIVQAEQAHPERYPKRQRVPFSALFVLPLDGQPLSLGLHRVTHPDFEAEEWFLSRVMIPGSDQRRAYYEAVFG